MKRIYTILVGSVNDMPQTILECQIQMEGMSTVKRAAILFGNGKGGALETVNGVAKQMFLNILDQTDWTKNDSKYIITPLSTYPPPAGNCTCPKTLTVVSVDGIAVSSSTTLLLTLNFEDPIFIISKNQGAVGTLGGSTGTNAVGNSLIYVPGVDRDNQRNFKIYEIAQTIDQLFTTLTT